ncbi:MAG: hypothetical protein QOE35_2678 [Actinomycetota bacterium]|jgi:Mg2+/Co2+ transporter CorC
MGRTDFHDVETDSLGFMTIRDLGECLAIGFGIEVDGDLDFGVSREDARRLGEALLAASASA